MTWTRRKFGCFAGAGCLAALGKTVGAPWGQDQKAAAMAAMVALAPRPTF